MLRGVRIVELCPLFPGPYATQILRHYGAAVTKVVGKPKTKLTASSKSPSGSSASGSAPHPMAAFNGSTLPGGEVGPMSVFDDGKETHALDLTQAQDAQQFRGLLKDADVAIMGHRPGSMEKYGFGPRQLRQEFPDLIVCCLTGFGLHGPLARRAGHDLNYLARAGVMGMRPGMYRPQEEEEDKQKTQKKESSTSAAAIRSPLPIQLADVAGGTYPVVMHVMAALVRRSQTNRLKMDDFPGSGCVMDVSLTDNSHALLVLSESVEAALGGGMIKFDNGQFFLCGAAPCYNMYPTKDGRYMAVGALEGPYWKKVVATLELPEHFAKGSIQFGMKDRETTMETIRQVFLTKTMAEWTTIFDAIDAMVDPVLTPEEAKNSPHLVHRRKWKDQVLKDVGVHTEDRHRELLAAVPPMPAMDILRDFSHL